FAGSRESEADFRRFARKKIVRDLNQNACAVARFRVTAACAAVRQIDENLNALLDDVVRFLAFDVGDKPNSACIMLLARVVQTLSLGESGYNLAFGGLRLIHIHTFSNRSNRLVGELPMTGLDLRSCPIMVSQY